MLAWAEWAANYQVAERLGVNQATVRKWRTRFIARRLEGLADEPRPGPPRTITDDDVEQVVVKTLEETPGDATHWSTRSLAKATGMSQSAVSRIWRAQGTRALGTTALGKEPGLEDGQCLGRRASGRRSPDVARRREEGGEHLGVVLGPDLVRGRRRQ